MRRAKFHKDQKGFTLVEILVSLVLLSIVLLSFLTIFTYTNQVAVRNNDTLVAVNLAKLTLARLKSDPFSYIESPNLSPSPSYVLGTKAYNHSSCTNETCESFYQPLVNDRVYAVSITASQSTSEKTNHLINVHVTVTLPETPISSKVEGYVIYD
ncbi:prepilin-type N-terminal cleavage/methylation domain-containing protein [Bacillus suaedae]|uniref:Prepilin-type N-terminal cleavage/methylation domain-containing protein n=1 Tax=Halalkalibacter suaedae TaxID=2822140 RepID=A0A941ALQ8_9BACI|nr:prepilin-type N-terminal cleavage/methylation domain-containing protein [Bacillus suaedae]MBP3949660.1 prepilin-type N-terminal cleavage/methylation domain-containing protein [Bacillus suaedae]